MSFSDSYHTDIDECSTGQHNCIGSTCENIPGSFSCQCKSKFTRKNATTCEGSCLFPRILSHFCVEDEMIVGIFHYIDYNLNPSLFMLSTVRAGLRVGKFYQPSLLASLQTRHSRKQIKKP